ncbi:hypothetical protein [Asticcacaulis benevestitus]|uniref:Uncharacterized protein n=1 Tax=Asticcacaulis benevestitus DSM 16100 = ATCC BAA-896 TaxID=1121022 RepID=V4P1H6_9CAUL|nr:hypothetical protein [Asticcacaulis benevestitus]ESQ87847.1 hypothetical protein ABENE_16535 [Asticcacaulis benevestitus DSM 16100 = ATCC BAA-896]
MAAAFGKSNDWLIVTAEAVSASFDKHGSEAQTFMKSIVAAG